MPFDLSFIVALAAFAVAIAAALFAFSLHRKGVPRDQIPGQVALKAGDLADSVRDAVVSALKEVAAKADQHTLRAAYFDRDDAVADIARLPASYTKMVTIDGAIVRAGDAPGTDYFTHPNGNVSTKAPAAT